MTVSRMPASWHKEPIHEVREIDGGYQATTTICMTTLSSVLIGDLLKTLSLLLLAQTRDLLRLCWLDSLLYLDMHDFTIPMSFLIRCLRKEK